MLDAGFQILDARHELYEKIRLIIKDRNQTLDSWF